MSAIPSHLARVPSQLATQLMRGQIASTTRDLLNLQVQIATGRAVNRPSDDAVATGIVNVLDDLLERRGQRLRNLDHGEAILNNVDAALANGSDILLEAKALASSQVGAGSDATTRAKEAEIIDAMLREMVNIANRKFRDVHLFGGASTATTPISDLLGGLRYAGRGEGITADLGLAQTIHVNSNGEEAFGALSARVSGDRDLNPGAVNETRLVDLNGRNGVGIRLGLINVEVNGTVYELDLSGADTVRNVIDELEDLLDTNEPGALGVNGITIDSGTENRFSIDLNPGFIVDITDPGPEAAASDLGLTDIIPFTDGGKETGYDFDPKLTALTGVGSLNGVVPPLGTIRITNAGQSRDLDLSGAQNVQDIMNAVAGLNLGVRVEIDEAGERLDFVNELSGTQMSVAEVGGGLTATELGVRSLDRTTLLADFNNGRGVDIISGSVDPVTGLPDPARDRDFRVGLADGRLFDVDLAGAVDVQDVLDSINAAAAAAGVLPAEFTADLATDGNGIELTDDTGVGTTTVSALNGSFAAEHLGILGETAGAVLTGTDRATVAVDSVFTHLMSLREALRSNDTTGITLAGEKIEQDLDRLAAARGGVGVSTRRIADAITREQELSIQDESLRSELRDLDITEAAVRFASLQTQLQAALATTSRVSSLSLLDFLR